jgi:diguanylate cyclase (GGDEF)-like protein/PAS domain S-box-containing protein
MENDDRMLYIKALNNIQHPFTSTFAGGPVIFFKWGRRLDGKRGRRSKKDKWGVEYVSPNIIQMGFKQEDFIGHNILLLDIFHSQDRQALIDGEMHLSQNRQGDDFFKGEFRIMAPKGRICWVYFFTASARNKEGNLVCYYSYFIDLTEQKNAEEAIEILARFPDENPNPVIRVKSDGDLVYANDAGLSLIKEWQAEVNKSLNVFCTSLLSDVLKAGEKRDCEVEIGKRVFLFTLTPIEGTEFIYLYGVDITIKKKVEEELKLAAIVYESSIQGIMVTGPDVTIQSINPAFTTITGYSHEEAIGQNPRMLKSNRHESDFYQEMWDNIDRTGKWQGEIWNRRKNGQIYPELLSISVIKDDSGNISHYVAVFNDIIELKLKESEIEYQAYHDPLTGLPNRSLFSDRLKMEISRTARSDNSHKLGVMFLDLDNFKDINDSLGHTVGDDLLQDVAKRLLECVRDVDTVARIGGDEFTVILPQILGPKEVVLVAQRILDVFKEPFEIQEHELFTTASIGISIYPSDGKDTIDLLKHADLAMYHAKDLGKNNYAFFAREMNVQMRKRLALENQMRRALKEDQFLLHYQPLVDIASGNMIGVEALVRWNHPQMGLISPDEFIPLAEETGLILKLGRWVLETGCNQNLVWRLMGLNSLYISVNISSMQFFREDFLSSIQLILADTGLPSNSLTLQVTENSIMGNRQKIVSIMNSLKRMGINLSIDDFGMGFSSLNYLRTFPVDTLKIDRTFIKGIPNDVDSIAITRSIISLAKNLNLKVLAEGVETKEQLEFLVKHGCDLMQGFYYFPPSTPEEITKIIKQKKNLYD